MSFYDRLYNVGDPNYIAPGETQPRDLLNSVHSVEAAQDLQIQRNRSEAQQTAEDEDVVELEKMSDYKSFSKGMMDIALMSANANQLRTALYYPYKHKWIVVGLITVSLFLQVIATCLLILEKGKRPKRNRNCPASNREGYKKCQRYNTAIAISVVLIIIVNVFITAFGNPTLEPSVPKPGNPNLEQADWLLGDD